MGEAAAAGHLGGSVEGGGEGERRGQWQSRGTAAPRGAHHEGLHLAREALRHPVGVVRQGGFARGPQQARRSHRRGALGGADERAGGGGAPSASKGQAAVREGSEASRGGRERSARERQESDGRADGWAYRGVGAAPAHFLRFFCGPLARPAVPCPRLPLPLLKSNPLPEQDDGAGEGPERKKQGSWRIAAASAPQGAWSSTPPPCGLPCPAGLAAAPTPVPCPAPQPPAPPPPRKPSPSPSSWCPRLQRLHHLQGAMKCTARRPRR